MACLSSTHINRLVIVNNKVVGEERLLADKKERFVMWLITTACSMPLPMEATFTGSAGNSMQPVKRRNIFVLISSAGMQHWQYVQRTLCLIILFTFI